MYALNISEIDGRILSATFKQYAPVDAICVDALPEGDIHEYRYENGQFIHDPLPVIDVEETPTQLDIIEAQVSYTAMMTDTLLEV